MKQLCVYIVRCSDKSYYTGVTNNVDNRIEQHNSGLVPTSYTFTRRPVELVFWEVFSSPNEAIGFEKKVKGWSRAKKEALINNNWARLEELSICKNKTSHLNNINSLANARTSAPLSVTDHTKSFTVTAHTQINNHK